mgnify:CR=1 FL=1
MLDVVLDRGTGLYTIAITEFKFIVREAANE